MRTLLLRAQLETAIERALALLDQIDGDCDLEINCDDDEDRSDYEAALCGIGFGRGDWSGQWVEAARSEPFVLNQCAA